MWHLTTALRIVFKNPAAIGLFLLLAIAVFAILVAIPAVTVPGNDLAFQLQILTWRDYLLLVSISLLTSLSVTFQIYLIKRKINNRPPLSIAGQTTTSFLSGIIASIFGTASCSACISSILSFLGFGAVLFLLKYRFYIVTVAIILTIISLYFVARKITGACDDCQPQLTQA